MRNIDKLLNAVFYPKEEQMTNEELLAQLRATREEMQYWRKRCEDIAKETQMIKFEYEEKQEEVKLTMVDVADGQFFIDLHDNLCQRSNSHKFTIIASSNGLPNGSIINAWSCDVEVKLILPHVVRITW